MPDNVSYIHNNKLAKYNYKYIDNNGTVYIGQKDGRLKKLEVTTSDIDSAINSKIKTGVSITSNTGTSSTTTQDMINPFLLMGG